MKNAIEIAIPETDGAIDGAYEGVAYDEYALKVTGNSDVSNIVWSIVDSKTSIINATADGSQYKDATIYALLNGGTYNETTLTTAAEFAETGLTFVNGKIAGTPKVGSAGNYVMVVEARVRESGAFKYAYRLIDITIAQPTVATGLELSADGTKIENGKTTVTLGEKGTLKVDGETALFDQILVKNKLEGIDIATKNNNGDDQDWGVHATVSEITYTKSTGNTAVFNRSLRTVAVTGTVDVAGYTSDASADDANVAAMDKLVSVVYDTDSTLNTGLDAYGIPIESGEFGSFYVYSGIPTVNAAGFMPAGTYEATITVSNGKYLTGTSSFTVKFTVSDTALIDTSNTFGITYGEALIEESGVYISASMSDGSTAQFTFEWKKAETAKATDLDIKTADSGLTLTTGGVITGTPTKAGTYKVTVTATSKTTPAVVSEKTFNLIVGGSATLTPTAAVSDNDKPATSVLTGNTVILPGMIEGATTASKIQITLTNSGSEDASNVKISVESAEDDFTAASKLAKTNYDYSKSAQYIVADKTSFAGIGSGGDHESFYLTTTGSPKAGEYKVKVTISGDNVSETVFYAYLVVVGKLTINELGTVDATVGTSRYIPVSATGAAAAQVIDWAEVKSADTTPTTLAANDITNDVTSAVASKYVYNSKINKAGYAGTNTSNIKLANKAGTTTKGSIETTGNDTATSTAKDDSVGGKTVKVGNTVYINSGSAAVTYNDNGTIQDGKGGVPTTAGEHGTVLYVETPATDFATVADHSGTTFVNKDDTYPTQYDTMSFTINVAKSSGVSINNLASNNPNNDPYTGVGNDTYDYVEGIQGTKLGANWATFTGYKFDSKAEGEASDVLTVTLKNTGAVGTGVVATLSLTGKDFELGNGTGTIVTDSKTKVKTMALADNGNTTFTISAPNTLKVKEGGYTDTLTISGDNMETITLGLEYVVSASTYQVDVKYQSSTNGGSTYDKKKAEIIGTANDVNGTVVLTGFEKGGSAAATDTIYVFNSGNMDLGDAKIVETDENYNPITNSKNTTLEFSVGSLTESSNIDGTALDDSVSSSDTTYNDGKIAIGKYALITIAPKNAATLEAKKYIAFVQISFVDGADDPVVVNVPLAYTVYAADLETLETNMTSDMVTLAESPENYVPATITGGEFTLTNTAEESDANAVYNVSATLIEGADKFDITSTDANATVATSGNSVSFVTIAAGNGTGTFKVIPAEKLAAGTHTATLEINADNLKKPIIHTISFKVTESEDFIWDVYSTAYTPAISITDADNTSYAQRLYNTLVYGESLVADGGVVVSRGSAGSDTRVVTLDLDGDKAADTEVTFKSNSTISGTASSAAATVKGMRIITTKPIAVATKTFGLNTEEITAITNSGLAATYIGANGKYFKNVTLNLYAAVVFYAEYDGTNADTIAASEYMIGTGEALNNNNVQVLGNDALASKEGYISGYNATRDSGTLGSSVTLKRTGTTFTYTGNEAVIAFVPCGTAAATVFGGTLPKVEKETKAFESWLDSTPSTPTEKVYDDTTVSQDSKYTVVWHKHTYPNSAKGDKENEIKWTWSDNLTQATVTLWCTDNCPGTDKGEITLTPAKDNLTITKKKEEANCVKGERTEYTASVTYNGKVYTDVKSSDEGELLGHEYKPAVVWEKKEAEDGTYSYEATITLICQREGCTSETEGHAPEISDIVYATPSVKTAATCTEKGVTEYGITSFKAGSTTMTPADFTAKYPEVAWTYEDTEVPATGHTVVYTAELNEDKTKATVKVTCSVCNKELFSGEVDVTAGKDESGVDAYVAEITVPEVKDPVKIYAYDHTHKWGNPAWDIKVVAGVITGTATFTCTPDDSTIKPHEESVSITVSEPESDGSFKIYTITAKDPAGKEYTCDNKVTVDANGNEVKGEAKTWTATYATSGLGTDTPSVTITFTGDNGAVDIVAVTPDAKVNGDVTTYSISYKDRAGKTHKMSWDYNTKTAEEKPGTEKTSGTDASVSEGEISVAFMVDPDTDADGNPQFVFTGAAIKPALVIRDEDRDVTLAEGVDYTLKWATNKAVGTAVVTVMGKGNYAGQSVTLSYKIADLKLGTDDFAVKKIKGFGTFTNGTDTGVTAPAYDGNAWTPEEITVTDANGADVVLKLQADGTYASEDGKTTAISIANNVNKGSATVSALNAKGKVVKKTFKIAAANLAAASDTDLTFDPDDAVWAAKGAVPANLNVEYKGVELVQGQDYTVKYSYASGKAAGEKAGKFIITGKKNFAGKAAEQTFDITALELADDAVSVSAFAGTTVKKIVPTVSDGNGAKIAPKALSVTVVKEGETTPLDAKTKLVAGDKITVTVKGVNETNISDSVDIDITVGANLGKAKVVSSSVTKYYTGEAIELTDEDMEKIAVTINKTTTLKYGEDFEIAGYQNNVKKGSMLVTIRGIGDKCSGSKTFKVKITPKTMKKAD